ncbi:hypothetical protein DL96DRAFT_1823875, partial [Flagelloscypha sp. PMI_526]
LLSFHCSHSQVLCCLGLRYPYTQPLHPGIHTFTEQGSPLNLVLLAFYTLLASVPRALSRPFPETRRIRPAF